ncbi:FAD-dependent oxidoreductase [Halomonas sp. KAO]|uniref:FAD-dependent oxidoreductase n=1 Tax=unclassified Halomonas TaxID=2609666 RepID=UPI00189E4DAB|nr:MULTISPECIES: FAD-dependent oxidoreductase [unclassified Halomonas]MBF7053620.1 FAD-dependent oxidoreductase [Halomonas sp. KAO]MDT0500899.1 FAD-dependent oxidoreductase [Halomonas sp. PAR7]MDT0512635.1 FAD-dependent oxidoreductase [Halomonas sp. LES1]MDT0593166.1 FAD-dependent oxidoreductase [Halomonas sp. PAR8]
MSAPLTILGSGMAGLGLLRQLRALDKERSVTLITADSGDDYSKPLLSTGFTKGLPPERLAARDALAVAESLNAVVRTQTRVDAIDTDSRILHIGEERLTYGELVLATGAAPTMPFDIPASLAGRVMAINDLDDYRAFHAAIGALGRSARVAIIGAGLVGCEFANDLLAGGHRVTLVAPETAPLPRLLPEPLGRALGEAFHAAGMALCMGSGVAGLAAEGSEAVVELDGGGSVVADLVLLATGLRPRTSLAERAGVEVSAAGIHTDRLMATSAPGVHALGDVACVDGVNAMYVQPLQAGARALAHTLAGTPTPVRYGPWPVLVKTPLLPVVSLPPAHPPARWRIEGEAGDLTALAEAEDSRLIGFALTGSCVRRKVELARAAPALLG